MSVPISNMKGTVMSMNTPAQGTPSKSKAVAAVLGFFLGSFGAADFYLGYKKIGIIKLVVWAVAMALYIPGYSAYVSALMSGDMSASMSPLMLIGSLLMFALGIWVLVTFIQILVRKGRYATDANGQPLA